MKLTWTDTWEISLELLEAYPDHNPRVIGLEGLVDLIIGLPAFTGAPDGVTSQQLKMIRDFWVAQWPGET